MTTSQHVRTLTLVGFLTLKVYFQEWLPKRQGYVIIASH